MKKKVNTSSLTEAAMIAGILVLFGLISNFLFPLIDFLFPVPVILLAKRRGFKYAALSAIAADLIIFMFVGLTGVLMYVLLYTPLAIAMSYMISKDKNPFHTIIVSTAVTFIMVIVLILVTQFISGVTFTSEIESLLKEYEVILKESTKLVGSKDALDVDQLMTMMSTMMKQLIPVFLIISAALLSIVNYMMALIFGKRFKAELKPLKDLAFFRLPGKFVVGYAIILLFSYLLKTFDILNGSVVFINVVIMGIFALLIDGLAVVKFFCVVTRLNTVIRILIVLAIVFFFSPFAVLLGALDIAFDTRNIRKMK